jgi:predicted alpha/beta-fold hydrolase
MALTYWPGACDITYTHSDEPLTLPTKSGPSRALPSLIADAVPPCNLNPFLPNGHLQTFWTAMKFDGPPIHYKRRTFAASKDSFAGHFTVDFVTAAPPPASSERDAEGNIAHDKGLTEDPVGVGHHYLPPRTTYFSDAAFDALGADDGKPLLICLHGLSGGSYETYLRHVLAPLVAETPEGAKAGGLSGGEWEALVVNSRGCAGSKITNSMLYNARATWDVRQTVKWAREKWPRRRMFGVGFSLGANILTTVGTSLCSSKRKQAKAASVSHSTFLPSEVSVGFFL